MIRSNPYNPGEQLGAEDVDATIDSAGVSAWTLLGITLLAAVAVWWLV